MLRCIENMSDKEFMGFIGNNDRIDIEVGDLVLTVGFDDDDRYMKNSINGDTLSLNKYMKSDKNNKEIMSVNKIDWEDGSVRLSNGYWYYAEYLAKI